MRKGVCCSPAGLCYLYYYHIIVSNSESNDDVHSIYIKIENIKLVDSLIVNADDKC